TIEFSTFKHLSVQGLVTDVGMVATAFSVSQKLFSEKFDLVINIGIAGAFDASLKIGDVVQVVSDRIVELGVEDNGVFIPADEMDLVDIDQTLFVSQTLVNCLPTVTGITVNRVHGSVDSILKTIHQFNPDVESMEGAAVAYTCHKLGIPWVQIRAISNKVEPRNKTNWNIPLALKNLQKEVTQYLKQLADEA
ncbi:futalosine hydrolase, partial [Bacteroidota bacterium]